MKGLLGDTDFIALSSRGGGYGPGTPREGWDHAQAWLPHSVSLTGLKPRIITAELTMADVNPAMADLRPLAAESLSGAARDRRAVGRRVRRLIARLPRLGGHADR